MKAETWMTITAYASVVLAVCGLATGLPLRDAGSPCLLWFAGWMMWALWPVIKP